MLIYNYKKEFLGMDKKDLNTLGFADLASLKTEVDDFADLFVKTPGYIHNFQHVHWIDFITCAESNEKPKAIINVNSKNFKCNIDVRSAFLVDNPSEEAFMISLTNLHPLSNEESELIAADIANKASLKAADISEKPHTPVTETLAPVEEIALGDEELNTFETLQEETYTPVLTDEDDFKLDVNLDMDDDFMQPTVEKTIQETPQPTPQKPQKIVTPQAVQSTSQIEEEDEDDDYTYDPNVASSELGLPLDLIEEFIQDFILQAKEFKADLYSSLESGDIENVKILSHKLKGVAANLRVENAFEVLTTINTTSDTTVIQENLRRFYKIIAKLAGEEEPQAPQPTKVETIENTTPEIQEKIEEPLNIDFQENDSELKLDINLDDLQIDVDLEENTPKKIETPEISLDEPELEMPEIQIPEISLDEPKLEIPEVQTPEISLDEPKLEMPEIQTPEISLDEPKLEIPEVQTPEISLDEPKLEMPEVQTPEISLDEPKLEMPEVQTPEISLDEPKEEISISYSRRIAASEIGIDENIIEELLEDYKSESETIFENIKTALENDDKEIYLSELHKFKSMTENMRIKDLQEILDRLELIHDKDEVAHYLNKMTAIINQILNTRD